MKSLLIAIVLLVCPAFVQAQQVEGPTAHLVRDGNFNYVVPTQSIVASENLELGELVVVRVSPIATVPQYFAGATYHWQVFENGKVKTNVQEWPDGTSLFFGAGMKQGSQFTIILSASYLYITSDKDGKVLGVGQRSALFVKVLTVGAVPTPDPGPNPPTPIPPAPSPVLPSGKFGLAKTAYDLAVSNMPSASRGKASPALANAFNGIAASVAAGTLKDIPTFLSQSKTANQTAIANAGLNAVDFAPFFTALQNVTYDLYNTNKLSTVQDFATAWQEVATGLTQVK